MLTHRPVKKSDIATLCTFAQTPEELFFFYPKAHYPITESQLLTAINERKHSTVVEKDAIIAGFANFYQWQQGGCCKIGNVIVNPTLRHQGIANYLIKCMIDQAVEYYQASEIQISCFNENTLGLLAYHKFGFQPFQIEARTNKQGNNVALIHLKYTLI